MSNEIHGYFGFKKIYDKIPLILNDNDNIIEIGAFLGKSTSYLANLIKKSGKKINFYVIDPWKKITSSPSSVIQNTVPENMYETFLENINNLDLLDYVIPMKMTSEQAFEQLKDKKFKFIFIDGSHQYENVMCDIISYDKLLLPDGILAGDDFQGAGVAKAVKETLDYFVINGDSGPTGNLIWLKNTNITREYFW